MKLDFSAPIADLKGAPIADDNGPVTLGTLAVTALMATYPGETDLSAKEKLTRFSLAQKIVAGGVVEIEVEHVATLKTLIGKAFGPLAVGRAYEIIERA